MKFSEHLSSHLTPEWRTQYIQYELMKEYLYKCVNERPSSFVSPDDLEKYFFACDADFFPMCLKELNKINNFFSEKLSEARRKFDDLKQELEAYREHIENRQQSTIFSRFNRESKRKSSERNVEVDVKDHSNRRLSVVKNFREHRFQNLQIRKKIKTLHDLKLGFSEFYLSLILLQNFQSLNFTGFRKILKKHDKLFSVNSGVSWRISNVDKSEFHTNREVDELIVQIETAYTKELESGDRQKAMKRLRVPPLADQQNSWSVFRFGFYLGIFLIQVIIIGLTIYVNYKYLPKYCGPAVRMFRSTFLLLLFVFLIGVNVHYWRGSGVNHVLIFEIDPRNHLTPIQLMEKSLRLLVLWGCCVLYFLFAPTIRCPSYIGPFTLVVGMILYILNPVPLFSYKSRKWLLYNMQRIVLAPFYTVKFADFWIADQLNSLSFLFLDMGYFICFFGFHIQWNNGFRTSADLITQPDDYIFNSGYQVYGYNSSYVSSIDNQVCSNLWYGINPILRALPAWFRFAQCLRRYYDNWSKTRELFPHVINAGKYFSSIVVVLLSALYSQYHSSKVGLSALLIACIVNSVYTCGWDILMDWGLFDRNSQEDKILRDELVYRFRIYYYLAIIENIIGRLMWVILVLLYKFPSQYREFIISIVLLVEVLRRFIWNFFRLENEHLNNVGEFRAVRDIFIAPIKTSFAAEQSDIKLNTLNKGNMSLSAIEQYSEHEKETDDDLYDQNQLSMEGAPQFTVNKWNFKNFKRIFQSTPEKLFQSVFELKVWTQGSSESFKSSASFSSRGKCGSV